MKNLYEVTYIISDRGIMYPSKTEEISVKPGEFVPDTLAKYLRKYRHAQDLSTKFVFKILNYKLIGQSK